MNRKLHFCVTAAMLVLTIGSAIASANDDNLVTRAELAAYLACRWSGLAVPAECGLVSVERAGLSGQVAQYSFFLKTGPDEYESIGLYRVIEERRPYRPKNRRDGVIMVHGDIWPFTGAFMTADGSGVVPDERALPVFLAMNKVDAWGIDLRWTRVPIDAPDPDAIMQDWGTQADIDDLGIALQFMRLYRLFTGSGFEQVTLLGWSRGGTTGYAYLGQESQRSQALRHVKAYIPVDIFLKTDDKNIRKNMCEIETYYAELINQSIFAVDNSILSIAGDLAIADPDGASPIIQGFTNGEVIVFDGGFPRDSYSPWYHFFGTDLDILQPLYTEAPLEYVFYARAAPFEPTRLLLEGQIMMCGEGESPFDDHLGDITVPVLYVGANGGIGAFGNYTTTLLGSSSVDTLLISQNPVNEQDDFGHADLFQAIEAEHLVWSPMLDWIKGH